MLVLSVVVHNFNVVGTFALPHKTDSPLVIDAEAVLPTAVALERLKLVARWNFEAGQFGRRMQLQELAPCYTLNVLEPRHNLATKERLCLGTVERVNHWFIVFCITETVKR